MGQHGTVNVGMGTILEPWEYTLLAEYWGKELRKLEVSRPTYGMSYLDKTPEQFADEVDEELVDVDGWAAMQYVALHAPADAARAAKVEHESRVQHIPPGQD